MPSWHPHTQGFPCPSWHADYYRDNSIPPRTQQDWEIPGPQSNRPAQEITFHLGSPSPNNQGPHNHTGLSQLMQAWPALWSSLTHPSGALTRCPGVPLFMDADARGTKVGDRDAGPRHTEAIPAVQRMAAPTCRRQGGAATTHGAVTGYVGTHPEPWAMQVHGINPPTVLPNPCHSCPGQEAARWLHSRPGPTAQALHDHSERHWQSLRPCQW